jgi:hypothetical protein
MIQANLIAALTINTRLRTSRLGRGVLDITELANSRAPFPTCEFAQLEPFLPTSALPSQLILFVPSLMVRPFDTL